jgi:DNA mismatch repair protein MutS
MLRHYLAVKARHPHALLLFRVGDFFEAYFDDAATLSRALSMELTRKKVKPAPRGGGAKREVAVAMAGFPHTHLEKHARALLSQGLPVALCQQHLVDAQTRTVRRSLERVLTAGTVFDEWLGEGNNFVAALLPAPAGQRAVGAGGGRGRGLGGCCEQERL